MTLLEALFLLAVGTFTLTPGVIGSIGYVALR